MTRSLTRISRSALNWRVASTVRLFNGRLVRPLKTLRLETQDVPGRRWWPRSPAMAAGLTDHLWAVKELLTTVVLPNT